MSLESMVTTKKGTRRIVIKDNNKDDKISIIVAVRNLGDEIEKLYELINSAIAQIDRVCEIIFVDDGSDDSTNELLAKITARDPQVTAIRLRANFGESSAFDAGFKHSTGNVIIYFTARVRINPQGLTKLLTKLDEGSDLVIGWRYPRSDSKLNHIISKLFNFIVGKLAKVELHDMNSGVLVTKREVLENINLYGDFNNFIPVLAARQGYIVNEEKIEQLRGKFRKSMYLKEYLQRMLDIITVLFLTNYLKKPIHFLGLVGSAFTILGAGIELYLFIYRILGLGPIAGRPMLLLGAMLLVIGIQMISIGLLGEMIIFTHAREIKEYNIEKIYKS